MFWTCENHMEWAQRAPCQQYLENIHGMKALQSSATALCDTQQHTQSAKQNPQYQPQMLKPAVVQMLAAIFIPFSRIIDSKQ